MKIKGYIKDINRFDVCPVDQCHAVCCRSQHFRPDKPAPCEYVQDNHLCELHVAGGPRCKPLGCVEYPRSQADIDGVNKSAEEAGFTERCMLYFED